MLSHLWERTCWVSLFQMLREWAFAVLWYHRYRRCHSPTEHRSVPGKVVWESWHLSSFSWWHVARVGRGGGGSRKKQGRAQQRILQSEFLAQLCPGFAMWPSWAWACFLHVWCRRQYSPSSRLTGRYWMWWQSFVKDQVHSRLHKIEIIGQDNGLG